jgi:solute carrier family 25 (mitochondrial citrate transporter), member 1
VRFGTNESLKNHVFTTPGRTTSFFAGLGAGIAEAILVVTPAETIKVKLIHDKLLEQP